ncbi:uncharacterized protein LOC109369505 isoform X2 [Meleagris gallopavo]|uniref:uncharacterized protein LOC109369505 isoform X2 n=1 Tax=Meleagris gallopavo TaxID=9103 RepID=UPI00093F4EEF|nr:uncharacterized protein LOC109369505 isoform X2 [Meleagris gallopavo]
MCSRHPHAMEPGTCSSLWGGTERPWLPGSVPMQLQLPAAGSPVPLGLCRRQAGLQGASEPPLCRELPVHVRALGTSWRHQDHFPPQKHRDPWGALPGLSRPCGAVGQGCPCASYLIPCPFPPNPRAPAVAMTPRYPHALLVPQSPPCQGHGSPGFPSFPGKGRELPLLLPHIPAAEPGDCDELRVRGASGRFLAPAGRPAAIARLLLPAQPCSLPAVPPRLHHGGGHQAVTLARPRSPQPSPVTGSQANRDNGREEQGQFPQLDRALPRPSHGVCSLPTTAAALISLGTCG